MPEIWIDKLWKEASQLNGFTLKKVYFKGIIAWAEVWAKNLYKICIEKEKETSVADETIKPYEIENSFAEHRAWFSVCFSEPAALREIWHFSPSKDTQEIPWSGKKDTYLLRTNQGS